jgi:N-acyl-D-aspartate/D-glutamate deacylase
LTGKSAARFGLAGRGVVREGAAADLVVFDAETIADQATYEQPTRPCVGVEQVMVNGRMVVFDGQAADGAAATVDGRLSGRYLTREARFN